MQDWAIETRGLAKRFGSIKAVDSIALRVREGETYGLLGPNGSGKTTLIRMLLGLVSPTAGEAYVLRKRMPNKEVLAAVGYMPQSDALYQELTVRENVRFFAQIYEADAQNKIATAIGLVGLEDRANSQVMFLSGGMKRRVSLACALVHQPRLLLLDEPTVGIDPQLRHFFWRHFRHLNEQGVTILLSTHVMDEAERCDRLGLMRDGRFLAEGTPAEIRATTGEPTVEEAFLHLAEGNDARV